MLPDRSFLIGQKNVTFLAIFKQCDDLIKLHKSLMIFLPYCTRPERGSKWNSCHDGVPTYRTTFNLEEGQGKKKAVNQPAKIHFQFFLAMCPYSMGSFIDREAVQSLSPLLKD